MLKLLLALYCALIAVVLGASSKKQQAPLNPEAKLQQITDLAAKSKSNVITLDDSTFSYYALGKSKPYNMIVYLTANHPKFKCGVCKQMDSELALVAAAYAKQVKANKEEPTTFFVRLDYESAQKTFQAFQLNTVPVLYYLNAVPDPKLKDYEVNIRDRFQVPADPDAESIANFLRERGGVSLKIERSMIFSYIIMLTVFGILAALVQPVINSMHIWLRIIQAKPVWMLVSAGIYTCAISGLIFDIIRSPQMYYANPHTGQIQFFYPQSGNQFVAEGFIIGFLNVVCAIAAVVVLTVAPSLKDEQSRTMCVVVGMVSFFICFRSIRGLYIMKNPWYGHVY